MGDSMARMPPATSRFWRVRLPPMTRAILLRCGPVELASAAVGVSVFNIVSKLFNIPLLSITASFVAEDVSRHDSDQFTSEGNMSGEIGGRKRLPSISSAILWLL